MTQKRFYLIGVEGHLHKYGIYCKPVLEDGKTGKQYVLALDLMELLNNLYEENTEQAIQIDFLKDENSHMRSVLEENRRLKKLLLQFYTEDEIKAELI